MEFVLLTSLFCVSVHVMILRDGMILNWLLPYLDRIPYFLQKPLFRCLNCMGGIYTLFHAVIAGEGFKMSLLIYMGAVIGLNELVILVYRVVEGIENLEQFNDEL